jgi:hypothetical protein
MCDAMSASRELQRQLKRIEPCHAAQQNAASDQKHEPPNSGK